MKRILGGLALSGLALTVICFLLAPAVAFMGIGSAAQSRDIAGLQQLIDFDSVRASLRPQLATRPVPQTPSPSFWRDPYGAIARQLDPQVLIPSRAPEPDIYLRPEALDALIRGEGRAAAVAKPSARPAAEKPPFARPIFWSWKRARLAVPGQDGSRTVFTFERRGVFDWKLVHIGLPPTSEAAAAPPVG